MSWADLLKLLFDWRVWAAAGVAALAVMLALTRAERDRADDLAESRAATIQSLNREKARTEQQLAAAQAAQSRAETALRDYSNASLANFQQQAEDSALTAARLAELNRRVRATQQEIARADASLRLDDPMPRGLRDALACAGSDAVACVPASQAPAGVLPGGAADPGRAAGSDS